MKVLVAHHHAHVPPLTNKYVKKKLIRNTFKTGAAVTGYYFLTHPANIGTSSLIGSVSSLAYVHFLSQYVENIESRGFQKQLMIPVGMILSETVWNQYHPTFELDFLTTLVGFFSYKIGLLYILLDIIKDDVINGIEEND